MIYYKNKRFVCRLVVDWTTFAPKEFVTVCLWILLSVNVRPIAITAEEDAMKNNSQMSVDS